MEELAETFVELVDNLVDEFELADVLSLLADRCVRLLDVTAAGSLLVDRGGRRQGTGGSDAESSRLCLLEDGPGHECYRSGEQVHSTDLVAAARWPEFSARAVAAGFLSVHALPLRSRGEALGGLLLLRSERGMLDKASLRVAQALADVTATGLVQARSLRRQADLAAQLQHALTSRVVIEQAKGVVAERLRVGVDAAFNALRRHARSTNTRMTDLAMAVVNGDFEIDRLRWR
ncbi:ANTAR domain-containing protein [Actinophytocola sp. S1-96]|uniref:ANTAR domain-containing protein n=1 Tax=Actinophytocola gossypii TaxID=2812003 RepID=A0ABT2JEP8_9PSEU|nr:ANTAR domain-containing protein [Actinophytocola gossypii]